MSARNKKSQSTFEIQATAKNILHALYKKYGSWRRVAEQFGKNKGLLNAIARGKRIAPPHVLKALGIKRRVYRDLFDWPVSELRQALEQRKEMK